MLWRRSYDTPPPEIADDNEFSQAGDPRYADLGDAMPKTECLKDVVARMIPYWESDIVPDLKDGKTVLVAAHGNSLRAAGLPPRRVAQAHRPRRRVPRPRGRQGRRGGRRQPGQVTYLR